jgi:hypothetical protein
MRRMSCGSALKPAPVRGPGLVEAAFQFERFIARMDPEQLTASDRNLLRDLLQELSLLIELGT